MRALSMDTGYEMDTGYQDSSNVDSLRRNEYTYFPVQTPAGQKGCDTNTNGSTCPTNSHSNTLYMGNI